jgi:hypothetical protein
LRLLDAAIGFISTDAMLPAEIVGDDDEDGE